MKLKYLLLSLGLLFLFGQCNRDKSDFELPYVTSFEIPPGIPAFPFQYVEVDVPNTNITQRFDAQGYTAEDISLINARALGLDIINSTSTFDFLERAFLEIRTEDLPQVEVGYLEFIPNNQGSSLDLIPSLTDVTEYLKSDRYTLIFKMHPRFSTTQVLQVRVNISFNVFAEE